MTSPAAGPRGREVSRASVLLGALALVVLTVVGLVAALADRDTPAGSAADHPTAPATVVAVAPPDRPDPAPAAPLPYSAPRPGPPAAGSCVVLDASVEGLARQAPCAGGPPVYEVVYSGADDSPGAAGCQFHYTYSSTFVGPVDTVVCLYPVLAAEHCYSLPAGDSGPRRHRDDRELVASLNAVLEPVACEGAGREPGDEVFRMVGETPGRGGSGCPSGTRAYVENLATERSSCLAPAQP